MTKAALQVFIGKIPSRPMELVYGCVLTLLLAGMSPNALAEDPLDRDVTLNIRSNTLLEDALIEWGAEVGMTVMIDTSTVIGKSTKAILTGHINARKALNILLKDSGLSYAQDGSRILIAPVGGFKHTVASPNWLDLTGGAQRRTDGADDNTTSADHGTSNLHLAYAGSGATAAEATGSNSVENLEQTRDQARLQSQGMDEVLVTAQKRSERLIDVPISIVALSSDEIQKHQVATIDDLQFTVPGLAIDDSGLNRRIELRGISNSFGSSSLIGLYLDEADVTSGLASQLDLRTYDLDRVEVLRGPQGTLYGEGSAGGTIRFITKDPDLNNFGVRADVSALLTEDGAPGQRIEEAINLPVINDVFALRIAGDFDHEGGWINQPAADRTAINDQNVADGRIKALWRPISELTVNAMAEIHRNDEGVNIGEDPNGNYTQVFGLTSTPRLVDDFDIYNLTLTYGVGPVRILNTTSYMEQYQDQTDFGYTLQFTPPGTTPFNVLLSPYFLHASYLTDELRASSTGDGPWKWTFGGYFRRSHFDQDSDYSYALPTLPGVVPAPYTSDSKNSSNAKSVFGNTSYQLMDRLTLGVGLRYFNDDQGYTNGLGTSATVQSGTFHSIDPRAYVQYKLNNNANVYASAAKGFRSGGFNALDQPSYGPESIWTYELGSKMSFLEGALSADTALFYSNYTNYQIVGILPPPSQPLNITSNAGNAKLKGIEWQLAWRPIEQWTFSLNGEYMSTRFDKISVTDSSYIVGDPIDYVPKYEYTVSAQKDFIIKDKRFFARLDFNEHGPETFRNRSLGSWYHAESDTINMLNFNTGVHWSDSLSLSVFAQNLLNDRGLIDPNNANTESDTSVRPRPRTLGIEFSVDF